MILKHKKKEEKFEASLQRKKEWTRKEKPFRAEELLFLKLSRI